MRSLADDVTDAARALESMMFSRQRRRRDLRAFIAMVSGFECAEVTLKVESRLSSAMLEDLLAKTQAALALVHAENARDPQLANHAALELVALIEAIGQRVSELPSSSFSAWRKQHAIIFS